MITEAIVIVRFVQHPIHPLSALHLQPVPAQNRTLLLSCSCRLISLCGLGFICQIAKFGKQADRLCTQCRMTLVQEQILYSSCCEKRRTTADVATMSLFFRFSCHLSFDCLLWRYSLINTNTDPCSMLRNVSLKILNLFATSCSFILCESKCF